MVLDVGPARKENGIITISVDAEYHLPGLVVMRKEVEQMEDGF